MYKRQKLDKRPTAIIGQNGAGKTTLVKLLKGLLKPVSGSIYFHGEDISGKTVAMLAGNVGYVFQNPDDQIFKYNVMDEILFGPLNIGMDAELSLIHILCADQPWNWCGSRNHGTSGLYEDLPEGYHHCLRGRPCGCGYFHSVKRSVLGRHYR